MAHIFLSYSTKDSDFADFIEEELKSNDYSVWRDRSNLRSGDQWVKSIEEALNNAWFLFVIVSNNSNESRWVLNEVEYSRNRNIPVIPILIEGEIGFRLSDLQYIDMRSKKSDHLPEDVYVKLLEYAPKTSIDNDIPLALLNGTIAERLSLIPKLREFVKNPRSPKSLAAKEILERLAHDEDEIVADAAVKVLHRNEKLNITPRTKNLKENRTPISTELIESHQSRGSVRNLILIAALSTFVLIAFVALILLLQTNSTPPITSVSDKEIGVPIASIGRQEIQVYLEPGGHSEPVGIARNEDLLVTGTSNDGQWVRVSFSGQDRWIRFTSNVTFIGDIGLAPVFPLPPSPTPTPTDTTTITITPSVTPSLTRTPTVTVTSSSTPTPTYTPSVTKIPSSTPSPTITIMPTDIPIFTEDFEDPLLFLWEVYLGEVNISKDSKGNSFWKITSPAEIVLNSSTSTRWTDYRFSVDFRITRFTNGKDDEADVIALKFRKDTSDPSQCIGSYEILYINNYIQAGKSCEDENSTFGGGASDQVQENTWHTIDAEIKGNRITWQLDNGRTYSVVDNTFTKGTFAIYASAGKLGQIEIDNIRVWR